ncbi:type II toxin-antitoxin system RelE/ParE family toxin [Desulfococcaceae bacterium HSG9]|nr:type II toxin-antitoxin system RelE/ParE family toxin [Desulfococcaceae bacterium HSG9]
MLDLGPNLGLPHTKSIEKGLLELRVKSKEGIARIFFCTRVGKKIIMLHSFIKKSQKTPKKEIKIAKIRMKEVMENDTR